MRKRRAPAFEGTVLILGILGILTCFAAYFSGAGVFPTTAMAIVALPALGIVVATAHYLDRWEVEPLWTRLLVFVWGAGVATLVAAELNTFGYDVLAMSLSDPFSASDATAVFVAPLTEETLKGAIVVLILFLRRHVVHSPLDGLGLGMLSGAGFAFVENIQYFLEVYNVSPGSLGAIVFLRGGMGLFVHPMATSLIGFAVAWAMTRTRSGTSWVPIGFLGWLCAVVFHGLWNYLAVEHSYQWLYLYLVVQVPLFLTWFVTVLVLAAREASLIAKGLEPVVKSGALFQVEVQMTTSMAKRRAAIRWAASGGPHAKVAMKRMLNNIAALGLDGYRSMRGVLPADRYSAIPLLLTQVRDDRDMVIKATSSATTQRHNTQ